MRKQLICKFLSLPMVLILVAFTNPSVTVQLEVNNPSPQVKYAISKIEVLDQTKVIQLVDNNADITLKASIDSLNLKPEAYKIISTNKLVTVTGGNAVGVMYGLLEVANELKAGKKTIQNKAETPNLAFRAIKFNLPWDSYRRSPALDLHYETCRDTVFWKDFLDMMAENRFNKLTLWNLHPFSYMVKTKKYPEGCSVSDKDLPEWQKFWTALFRMAKNRGIDTYLMNWNIFVSPEFAKAHNVCDYCIAGKYNVPVGDQSEIIKDYTRECVKEVIDTYPDLAGLGITLGEGMGGMSAEERGKWILDSYINGARMASRKIKFIYRVPLSAGTASGGSTSIEVEKMTRATLDTLTCFDGPINIELKFNWSHAFSTPYLVKVHGGKLNDAYWNPMPTNYYLAWMMRNEDFYTLRWGQTEFLRRHVEKNTPAHVNGYYVGSETYIPAKDYMTALPGLKTKYAFERQWMYYKTLGRIYYNPTTPDQTFIDEFEYRFPTLGKKLFYAQQKASKVPLVVASWFNGTWDMALYSEGMMQTVSTNGKKAYKLMPLEVIADKIPMDPEYMSIDDFLANNKELVKAKTSPLQLADSLANLCTKAIDEVKNINTNKDVNLLYEGSDIKAWSYLGLYFSNKLRASVDYKRYKLSNNTKDLDNAIAWLTKATQNWRSLVEVTSPIYKKMPLTHYCDNAPEFKEELFHWSIIEKQVIDELERIKSMKK